MKLADHWKIVTEANVGAIRMWGEPRFDAYGHETTSEIERRSENLRECRESCISGEVMELRSESMDKHTPGPWFWCMNDGCFDSLWGGANGSQNVMSANEDCKSESEVFRFIDVYSKDAALIKAAPDLLDACRAMLTCCGGSDNWNGETQEALKKIEAAIAKATSNGET